MSGPETTDRFDWRNDDSVVVKRQPALAVYENPDGAVVIRQENDDPFEEDMYVVIRPDRLEAVMRAMSAWLPARQPDQVAPPRKGGSAARMRRLRAKEKEKLAGETSHRHQQVTRDGRSRDAVTVTPVTSGDPRDGKQGSLLDG